MHPIVIMAYEKSPAINKAVAALEEAGMEVRVLNTNHAKLADFLGALAGEEDEEDAVPAKAAEEPPVEDAEEVDDVPPAPAEEAGEEAPVKESLRVMVDGEEIDCVIVEGATQLFANTLHVDSKSSYTINESSYAFWPSQAEDGLFSLKHNLQVQVGEKAIFVEANIGATQNAKPLLKLSAEDYKKLVG